MAKKVQMTITVEKEHKDYVISMAKERFEGDASMAIRKIIDDHKKGKKVVD